MSTASTSTKTKPAIPMSNNDENPSSPPTKAMATGTAPVPHSSNDPPDSASQAQSTHKYKNNSNQSKDDTSSFPEFDPTKESIVEHCRSLLLEFDTSSKGKIFRLVVGAAMRENKLFLGHLDIWGEIFSDTEGGQAFKRLGRALQFSMARSMGTDLERSLQ